MARTLILAGGMLALAVLPGSAQSVGVSAVIVESVEAAPAKYDVKLGPAGYEIRTTQVKARRSLLLERTLVGSGAAGVAEMRPVPTSAPRSEEAPAGAVLERTESDRLLVTRVIAVNA